MSRMVARLFVLKVVAYSDGINTLEYNEIYKLTKCCYHQEKPIMHQFSELVKNHTSCLHITTINYAVSVYCHRYLFLATCEIFHTAIR